MQVEIDVEPGHQSFMLAYHLADLAGDFSKKAYDRYCVTGEQEEDPIWVQFTEDAKYFWNLSKLVGRVKDESSRDQGESRGTP